MQTHSLINRGDLLCVVCLILYLKTIVNYPDSISVMLTGLLFLICIVCAFKVFLSRGDRHDGFLYAFTILMLMFTIYGGICILKGEEYNVGTRVYTSRMYLMDIYVSLLPIYAFYYYSSKGFLSHRSVARFFFACAIITVFLYFKTENNNLLNASSEADGVVNNISYSFLSMLVGTSLFFNKRWLQYTIFGLVAVFLLLGLKRGAMLVYPLCLLFFLSVIMKDSSRNRKVTVYVLSLIFIAGLIWYIQYRYSIDSFFRSRMELTEEMGSSGRDVLFSTFWSHFVTNPNLYQQLFGEGAMSTVKVSYNFAHNDWLEILINQGVLGVIIYLIYWVSLIRTWRKSQSVNSAVYLAIGLFAIIFFMRSLYSMGYTGCDYATASVFGYYLACYYRSQTITRLQRQ